MLRWRWRGVETLEERDGGAQLRKHASEEEPVALPPRTTFGEEGEGTTGRGRFLVEDRKHTWLSLSHVVHGNNAIHSLQYISVTLYLMSDTRI